MFKYYTDPGHGWLAVKLQTLADLGISKAISEYSYVKGRTAYLEEDMDMQTFIKAYTAKYGKEPQIDARAQSKKQSPIRSYNRYWSCI